MGRIAAPAHLKLINGRSQGRDSGGREVPPPAAFEHGEVPEAPEWLPDEGKAEWARVAPTLATLKLIKPEDRAAFAAYCNAWAQYVQAVRMYKDEGLTIINPQSGRESVHPAVTVAQTASRELLRYAQHFGLTPSSEQNIARGAGDPDGGGDNPFASGQ
ncbi:phage terminase small subunit P27 family [Mycobacteroides sp. PCS013]|uniref:phage terminase small subunit P27 family n=1 Tax=Mycobacteroides sp. PCS013 TaxID=3074106 RepID=UPI003C2B5DBF